jgi:hypothetical protein
MLRTDANNAWVLTINDYASTTNFKPVSWYGNYLTSSSASASVNLAGNFRSNSAISSLYIWNYAGNFSTGTVKVYGVN